MALSLPGLFRRDLSKRPQRRIPPSRTGHWRVPPWRIVLTLALLLGGVGIGGLLVASELTVDRNGFCEYRSFRDPVTGRERARPMIVCVHDKAGAH